MSHMRRLAFFVCVLCIGATACRKEDTERPGKWPRAIEARVTGAQWRQCTPKSLGSDRVVQDVDCEAQDTVPTDHCSLGELTHESAVKLLQNEPQCLDDAIVALESVSSADLTARRDLAAAYYTRAQRDDHASDLLLAYEAAENAVAFDRTDPIARFNLALVQQAIGLDEQALASWKAVPADGDAKWNAEVLGRRRAMERRVAVNGMREWNDNKKEMLASARARDEKKVAALIDRFPKSAMEYLESEVLSKWGDTNAIQFFAAQLSKRLGGDPYPLDVARIAAQSGVKPALYLSNQRGVAVGLVFAHRPDDAIKILDALETQASTRGYTYLCALIHETRGLARYEQDRYVESINAYEAAAPTYRRLRDDEGLANVSRSNAGTYRVAGQFELSWRDALRAKSRGRRVVNPTKRHGIDGEIAATALALGQPGVALAYQNQAVAALQAPRPGDLRPLKQIRFELGVAKRERARIETVVGDLATADSDLKDTADLHLNEDPSRLGLDTDARRILDFRFAEVHGRQLLSDNRPSAAAAEFSHALERLEKNEFRSFRAALLVERAEAYRRLGRTAEAQHDLEAAVAALRREQKGILLAREIGEGERVWSTYFSRFDDAYERLIEHLIETGETEKSFQYAERSRASEVLDLVRVLPFSPPEFRELTEDGEPIALADLQRHIPAGTYLLQYCITDDRVYTFVIARDSFDVVTHQQDRNRITLRRLAESLQTQGRLGNETRFEISARAAYAQLLRDPFAAIQQRNGGHVPERIVIVSDDAMHGMPFAALRNLDTGRYIVEDTTVETAASATMYVFTLLRRGALPALPSTALLVGDPAFDGTMPLAYKLSRLPGALGEVSAIRPSYPAGAQVIQEEQATVAAFVTGARDKSVIHFAGHSLVSAQSPWTSMLLFAPSDKDRGVLEAQSLLTALTLDKTQLVVLAACSSAGGLPVGAEGVGPLVRPFLARGAPAVVGTLWPVNDATAADLFVSFHQDYGKHGDAAVALRAAQLAQIRKNNPGSKSIRAWAPFQVVGH